MIWAKNIIGRTLLAAALLSSNDPSSGATPPQPGLQTQVTMRRIRLFQFDDASSSIEYLEGAMVATRPGRMVNLNNVASFAIQVQKARVTVPAATMAALMNRHILPAAGVSISGVRIAFSGNTILIDGKIHKAGLPLSFHVIAVPEATPQGELRLRIIRMKAAGLFSKGFLERIGLGMPALLKPRDPKVLRVNRDTMTIPVGAMFPAPFLDGRLSAVHVGSAGLVATIGRSPPPERPGQAAGPAITLSGGTIRFAHIIMPVARLEIRPTRSEAEFSFSPAHYYAQMVRGYSRATPDYGLIGYFSDFGAQARH